MANGLSLTADMNSTRVFECPNCKQTIDTTAAQCRFCHVAIDPDDAEAAANHMSRINRACNDASYLRIAMVCGAVFFGLMLLPIIGGVGALGYLFLKFAIPIWVIAWFVRFGGLKTDDRDLLRLRRFMLFVAIPVSALLACDAIYAVATWIHRAFSH